MKEIFIFLFLIIIATSSVESQDLFDVYEIHYPEEIRRNPQLKILEEDKLKIYSKLDPGLIYFYLENLKKRHVQKFTDPDSNWTNLFLSNFKHKKYLRTQWANNQKDLLDYDSGLWIKKREILDYMSNYFSNESEDRTPNNPKLIDENKIYFFHYIYLTNAQKVQYDSATDYLELTNINSNKLVGDFTRAYDTLADLNKSLRRDWIDKALKYPFLFKNSYLNIYKKTTDFYLYEFIEKALRPEYINFYSVGIQINTNLADNDFKIPLEIVDYVGRKFIYEYNIIVQAALPIYIMGKIKLRDYLTMMSFINFRFGYLGLNCLSTDFHDGARWRSGALKSGFSANGILFLDTIQNFKANVYCLRISTPIFFYTNKLYMEFGLNSTYLENSYQYRYAFEGEIWDRIGQIQDDFWRMRKFTYSDFKIYPEISVVYAIVSSINLRSTYVITENELTEIGISYYYHF